MPDAAICGGLVSTVSISGLRMWFLADNNWIGYVRNISTWTWGVAGLAEESIHTQVISFVPAPLFHKNLIFLEFAQSCEAVATLFLLR